MSISTSSISTSIADRYQIRRPTIALFLEDDRHVAHMVPAGAVIVVDSDRFNGNKLVEVMWDGKKAMMFTQDIRKRGKKLNSTAMAR